MKPTLHNLTTLVLGAFLALWMLYANLCVPEFFSGGAMTFGLLGVGLLVLMCLEGGDDDFGGPPPGVKTGTISGAHLVQQLRVRPA